MKALLIPSFLCAALTGWSQVKFTPPATPQRPVTDTLHGTYLTDQYRWLEDKENQDVINWTRKQHDYGVEFLEKTQKVHPGLKESIAAIVDLDYEGPYNKVGKRVFQSVKRKGDKQSKLYTILDGKKILIWDPVELDASGSTSTNGIEYTYDGERAAITVQTGGDEIGTTYFINTRTGKKMYEPIKNTSGFSWCKDQEHAYITFRSRKDIDGQLPLKTYLWKAGDKPTKLQFVGSTTDAKNSYYVYDNHYSNVSFYGEGDFYSNNCYIRPTGTTGKGTLIYESTKSASYPEAIGEKLYIFTNDNAPNYKLMVGDVKQPNSSNWKVLIPEGETVMQGYAITKDGIIIQDKKDVVSRLTWYDLDGKRIKEIPLPETGSVSGFSYDREEDSVYVS
ncbi:MAG: hypothetical protein V4616_02650, partial [Bacteroidota bacterium]